MRLVNRGSSAERTLTGGFPKRDELFFSSFFFRGKRSPVKKHFDLDQAGTVFLSSSLWARKRNLKSNELRLLNGTLTLLIERVWEKAVGEACFSVKHHEPWTFSNLLSRKDRKSKEICYLDHQFQSFRKEEVCSLWWRFNLLCLISKQKLHFFSGVDRRQQSISKWLSAMKWGNASEK